MESLLEQSDVARIKGRCWRRSRNIIFLTLVVGFITWGAIKYYYPYSEGIKSGKLDYVVYEGWVFKTYEGKLVRSETILSETVNVSDNSDFVFSAANKSIAEQLMKAGGKTVKLRYTEYFGAIPWRGQSRFVVVEVISLSE